MTGGWVYDDLFSLYNNGTGDRGSLVAISRAAVGMGIRMGMGMDMIFHPTDQWGFLSNLKWRVEHEINGVCLSFAE